MRSGALGRLGTPSSEQGTEPTQQSSKPQEKKIAVESASMGILPGSSLKRREIIRVRLRVRARARARLSIWGIYSSGYRNLEMTFVSKEL